MSQTVSAVASADVPDQGLVQRLFGVLFAPRLTFAGIAARPRALGALLFVTLVMIACQMAFMSTETGKEIVLDQQVRVMESFGMTVTDQMYAQLEAGLDRGRYINAGATLVIAPIINAVFAGLLLVVFTMLLGGSGTFKQLYAVTAHAGVVIAVQQLFSTPLSYASGRIAGANLGVFVPMLEETHVVTRFLESIDLFLIWWLVVLAIGLGVLYRRRTGPIATGLISLYVLIALVIAFVRS
jgi:hypothetical protein